MSRYVSKHAKPEDKPKKKKGFLRRFFGFIGFLILMIVLLAGALIGFLSATEYKPADTEDIAFDGDASGKLAADHHRSCPYRSGNDRRRKETENGERAVIRYVA